MTEKKTTIENFTPGPWRYCQANNYHGFAICPDMRLPTLAACVEGGDPYSKEGVFVHNFPGQTQANAALISCAPEMYAMLKKIHEHFDYDEDFCLFADDVEELLNKARGEG